MGHVRGLVLTPTLPWLACRTRQQRREGFNPALLSAEDLEPAVLPVGSILPGKLGDQGDRGEAASGVPGPGIGQSICETHTFHGQVRKEATLGH